MTIKLKLIVLLVLFSITSVIYSQSQSITMTLDEAVNYALSNSYASNRITSYNVCYTKLLRTFPSLRCPRGDYTESGVVGP